MNWLNFRQKHFYFFGLKLFSYKDGTGPKTPQKKKGSLKSRQVALARDRTSRKSPLFLVWQLYIYDKCDFMKTTRPSWTLSTLLLFWYDYLTLQLTISDYAILFSNQKWKVRNAQWEGWGRNAQEGEKRSTQGRRDGDSHIFQTHT